MVLFDTGTVRIKYGADFQLLDLESVSMQAILAANEVSPIGDPSCAIKQALDKPTDNSEPLADRIQPGQRVLITTVDYTKRWFRPHVFLPKLLDYLNDHGIPDNNITILIANGPLRPRPDQHRCIIGDEVQQRVAVIDHDSSKDDHVYIGTTTQGVPVYINKLVQEHDHLIVTGGISYDLLAGFSGGRDAICPGICGAETIKANHNLATLSDGSYEIGPGLLTANPIHEDMMAISSLVKPTFCFNVVCDDLGKHVAYFSGNWDTAWHLGCRQVQQYFAIPVYEPADVVVASVGGYPRDENFYSSVKGLYQSTGAVKPGGSIIFLAECSEGHGNSTFFESMLLGSTNQLELSLASAFSVPKQIAFLHAQIIENFRVILVSSLSDGECRRLGMTPASSLTEAITLLRQEKRKKPEVALLPQADLTLPIPLK